MDIIFSVGIEICVYLTFPGHLLHVVYPQEGKQ